MYKQSSKSNLTGINVLHLFDQAYITPLHISSLYPYLQTESLWPFPFCNKRAWAWPNCIATVVRPFAYLYPYGIYARYIAKVISMLLFLRDIALLDIALCCYWYCSTNYSVVLLPLLLVGNVLSLGLIPSSSPF